MFKRREELRIYWYRIMKGWRNPNAHYYHELDKIDNILLVGYIKDGLFYNVSRQ